MAETNAIKRYKMMPFEIYYNEHTCLYHLIEHKGYAQCGAWSVNLIGRYETFMDARSIMEQFIEEAMKKPTIIVREE